MPKLLVSTQLAVAIDGQASIASAATIIATVVTIAVILFGILKEWIHARRAWDIKTGKEFQSIVKSLTCGENQDEKVVAAILIRRFLKLESEFSRGFWMMRKKSSIYAQDAVQVISALLREPKTLPLVRKALADGLREAVSLEGADFQSADFNDAYLGGKDKESGLDMTSVDFSKAKFENASLKYISGNDPVFRKIQAKKLTFEGATLKYANFSGATLGECDFSKVKLTECRFIESELAPLPEEEPKTKSDNTEAESTKEKVTEASKGNAVACNFRGATLVDCDFSGAILVNQKPNDGGLLICDFREATLVRCILPEGHFEELFSCAKNYADLVPKGGDEHGESGSDNAKSILGFFQGIWEWMQRSS